MMVGASFLVEVLAVILTNGLRRQVTWLGIGHNNANALTLFLYLTSLSFCIPRIHVFGNSHIHMYLTDH